MTWNARGMHYGHFPLTALTSLAVARAPGPSHTNAGYRLRLRGGELVLEGRGGRFGLDGRALSDRFLPGQP
jgi:hypothetical protein